MSVLTNFIRRILGPASFPVTKRQVQQTPPEVKQTAEPTPVAVGDSKKPTSV